MTAPFRILAILLIVAGSLSLTYHGLTYTKETHGADIGGLHLSVDEKEHVRIPPWMAGASIALGVLMLVGKRMS